MPDKDVVLVLDTNVVSALHAVAGAGIRSGHADDERVAGLLRWLNARPDAKVSVLFGVLEGSGFSSGGLRPFGLLQRAVVAERLLDWGRRDPEDFIASGAPAPDLPFLEEAFSPQVAVDMAELLLPWTVLPGWVAALLMWSAHEQALTGTDALAHIHAALVARLDFVPGPAWLACVQLFAGPPARRRHLAERLMKFQGHQRERDSAGAAWDLGYLGLLSVTRTPELRTLFGGRLPVLVSADRGLNLLAPHILAEGNTGALAVDGDQLDPLLAGATMALLARLSAARAATRAGSPPTWDSCAKAVYDLQTSLGFACPQTPTLVRAAVAVEVGVDELERWIDALACPDVSAVVVAITGARAAGHDLVPAGLVMLVALTADNARARRRATADSWGAALGLLPPGAAAVQTPNVLVRLGRAVEAGDKAMTAAWIGKLQAHGAWDVELWLWKLAGGLLADTAQARGREVTDLLEALRASLRIAAEGE